MNIFPKKQGLLALTQLIILAPLCIPAAWGQCAPDPTVPGGTVTCSGNDSDGFTTALNDVTVLIPGTVNPAALGSHGISILGDNADVQLTGTGSISTTVGGAGVRLDGIDATVSVGSGTSIMVTGNTGGIALNSTGATITVDGSISGSGHFGHGIITVGNSGTSVTVNSSGSVTTTGDDARAIDLQASDSHITLAGTVMTSGGQFTGDTAHALIVGDSNLGTTGGTINLLPSARITVNAEGAGGILASGSNTLVTIAAGALVTVNGDAGSMNGVPAFGAGNDSNNGILNNSGELRANLATGSVGAILRGADPVFNNLPSGTIIGGGLFPPFQVAFAFIGDPGTTATLNNTGTITGTVGNLGDGNMILVNSGSGTISENVFGGDANDTVTATALITGDIFLEDGNDFLTLTAASIGGALNGGDGTSSADGSTDRVHISSGTRSVTDGTLEEWEIVQLSGTTVLEANLAALAVGGDAGTDATSGLPYGLVLQDASRLSLLQSLNLAGNISNGSTVDLSANGTAGTLLTVTGSYTGSGGELILETALDDDASPTDRLIVDGGSISGTTALRIQNAGGLGAPSTGDGFLLIETTGGATSSSDAFSLAAPVSVGGFAYELFFGGVSDPNDGNWYLRSRASESIVSVPTLPGPLLLLLSSILVVLGGVLSKRRA